MINKKLMSIKKLGHTPWNKNKKMPEETRLKIIEAQKNSEKYQAWVKIFCKLQTGKRASKQLNLKKEQEL